MVLRPLVEHRDQVGVADAEQGFFERDGVADLQRAHLRFGDGRFEDVVGHLKSIPPGVITALARRAEWHWMFTATGFIVMWVAATST